MAHGTFLLDGGLHVLRLVLDLLNNLFLVSDSSLLFLYQSVLDRGKLSSNRIQMVVVVFDAILSLLVDSSFALVHPGMVFNHLLSENLTLSLDLVL